MIRKKLSPPFLIILNKKKYIKNEINGKFYAKPVGI